MFLSAICSYQLEVLIIGLWVSIALYAQLLSLACYLMFSQALLAT